MSRHRQNEMPTEHSTAQEVLDLISRSENDGQPPPDNLTVAGIINWIPEIDVSHRRQLICHEETTENDDWQFADKVCFRVTQCAKALGWKTGYIDDTIPLLKLINSTKPDNHYLWHSYVKHILPKILNPPQLNDGLNLLERLTEKINNLDVDVDFAQWGDTFIEASKAVVLAARKPNLDINDFAQWGDKFLKVVRVPFLRNGELSTDIKYLILAISIPEMTGALREFNTIWEKACEHDNDLKYAMLEIRIAEATEAIEEINSVWVKARKHDNELKHPITPIVTAYIAEMTAKRIDKEHDRKYPVAVLKNPLGSIRDVNFVDTDSARLREFATPESITQVDHSQAVFDFAQEPPSVLPEFMFLDIATPLGIKPNTRSGAVRHVLRIFDEALMALNPSETQGNISFILGDLIDYLYPDRKFHRTNQLPYIINALDILHFYATVPFKQPLSGGIGRWRPVVVRNALHKNSKNDDLIFLDVRLPEDAKQGMLVEKHTLRILGKQSAPQYYAYKSACGIWNKYGTINGKLIDPTQPVINRNSEGYLVDTNGNELIGTDSKRIKNPYRSDAIAQLEREDNPKRTKYPILSNSDLIKACYPCGQMQSIPNRRAALKRAKKYWTQLETEGIVKIERFREGWRIIPSESHMQAYRAMTEAIKQSRKSG